MSKQLLSQRHPLLHVLAVWVKRIQRYCSWYSDRSRYCRTQTEEKLPYRVKRHKSLLIRKLGESEMYLQHNKIKNLLIAIKHLDGLLIQPGETFSFCRLVGLPTKRKGYVEGMEISGGEARPGIGGGICQISNMIYWLVIHSDLTVTERRHHGYDPFPDNNRVLPFGSGATVFYNYVDLQFRNDTSFTFQLSLWLTEKHLCGELRVVQEPEFTYFVYEDKHEFLKIADKFYRRNEIWRRKMLRQGGKMVARELITKNFAEVKYIPEGYRC